MSDDVRRWSDALARDPSSTVFLQLGEALRRQGQAELAQRVALRGLERHPHMADAHDLLARICADVGDLQRAFDEWDMVLRLSPGATAALKGMGFVCFRQGQLAEAERYLSEAAAADPSDGSITSALEHVRVLAADERSQRERKGGTTGNGANGNDANRPDTHEGRANGRSAAVGDALEGAAGNGVSGAHGAAADPRALFQDVLGDARQTALLLDASGFVLAGGYVLEDGRDVAQDVGAELSGVSDEAQRTVRHLGLGDWSSIVLETEVATVAIAPAPDNGLLLVAAARESPLGLVRRVLDRAGERARRWLGSVS